MSVVKTSIERTVKFIMNETVNKLMCKTSLVRNRLVAR